MVQTISLQKFLVFSRLHDGAFIQNDYMIGIEANWTDPDTSEANIGWARNLVAQLAPFSSGGSYLNFGGYSEEGQVVVEDVYNKNLQRLAAIKKKYDPGNLFRVNHNIKPAD